MFSTMSRIRIVGIVIIVAGVGLASAGFFWGMPMADDGLDAAQKMYAAEGITLNYNDDGKLIDRGTEEGAQNIMALLRDEWDYPVSMKNFDPDDPLVNTRDEVMFQYATVYYHVLHAQQDVVLTDEQVPITYRGVTYDTAGTYPIEVGKSYAQLDRTHPIEGQLRAAWSPLALSIVGALAAAHANEAAGELAWFTSLATGGMGLMFALVGAGLLWVGIRPKADGDKDAGHAGRGNAKARPPRKREAPASGRPRPEKPAIQQPVERRP